MNHLMRGAGYKLNFIHSLKFQIIFALAILVSLFSASMLFFLHTLERQRNDDLLLQMAGQLQITQQQLSMQAMNYKENAPRDYPTYYRDLRLYYQDLNSHRKNLKQIINAFASGHFSADLTGHPMDMDTAMDEYLHQAATQLQTAWQAFNTGLDGRLGTDEKEPRLEWAAEWILAEKSKLAEASDQLLQTLQTEVTQRAERANLLGRSMIAISAIGSMLVLVWFYFYVLQPLQQTVKGFQRVATGDFAYQLSVQQQNEIGFLVSNFNSLGKRLDSLLKLIAALQQSTDLDETLKTISHQLPNLVPLDWVGILLQGPDGRMHLQQAYSDGQPDHLGQMSFELENTLLLECIHSGQPLHIADIKTTSKLDSHYRFLQVLDSHKRQEAVFMPVVDTKPVVGVVVFASRHANTYRQEHLALLNNLSHLFSLSFGRTITLIESTRLAAIGQFASGIVHEIRNPLATISLALEHFDNLEGLPNSAKKRAGLASNETERLTRLLDDILLYAKPLQLKRVKTNLRTLFAELSDDALMREPLVQVAEMSDLPDLMLDKDRIKQVMLNLLKNALEANGQDQVGVAITAMADAGQVKLTIHNGGETIPEDKMERLFEPFYTSKAAGTGLGLPIVKRILLAHGGDIRIQSSDEHGTVVDVVLSTELVG